MVRPPRGSTCALRSADSSVTLLAETPLIAGFAGGSGMKTSTLFDSGVVDVHVAARGVNSDPATAGQVPSAKAFDERAHRHGVARFRNGTARRRVEQRDTRHVIDIDIIGSINLQRRRLFLRYPVLRSAILPRC